MLDSLARRILDPGLRRGARLLVGAGIGADAVTWAGFCIGAAAAGAIVFQAYAAGFLLIGLSRLCDGLDGAVARLTAKTDRGGYLDIVLDFAFYGLVPLGFIMARPLDNALAGATLIFSFYVNGASFLAFAIMAEKRALTGDMRGEKSLYFTTGLAEATETIAVFLLACLFPSAFAPIAYVFAAICLVTAGSRVLLALRVFA